jgi:hypothetical protein
MHWTAKTSKFMLAVMDTISLPVKLDKYILHVAAKYLPSKILCKLLLKWLQTIPSSM